MSDNGYIPRLKQRYHESVVGAMREAFGYSNDLQVPRLVKISVNKGVGEATQNAKLLEGAVQELRAITGQHPTIRRARKSVSNFKLREGMAVGAMVTLRGARMWEFLDRLITLALPRVRDFRGVPDGSFDGRGNYSLGVKEQIIFPEVRVDQIEKISGLDITCVTTAKTDEEALALLRALGMPFVRREQQR